MIACGFQEIITYALTSQEALEKLSARPGLAEIGPLRIFNTMSRELEFLRTSLRAGVLSVLARNQRGRESNIRLFEVGKVYIPRKKDLPREKEMLCAAVDSVVPENYWQVKPRSVDFYLVKGVVEAMLDRYGIQADFMPGEDPSLNPAKCADIMVGKARLGVLGELHPKVLAAFDISDTAFLFELDVDKLAELASKRPVYQPASKYPSTTRDIALIVSDEVTYKTLLGIMQGFSLVAEVKLFDLYAGEQIPAGKKSMAFRLTYQASDHTLKDEEVDAEQKKLLDRLAKETGASLRS